MLASRVIAGLFVTTVVADRGPASEGTGVLPLPIQQPRSAVAAKAPQARPPLQVLLPLTVVAEIDSVLDGAVHFGDTDRDGLMEIVSQDYTHLWRTCIVERQADNSYVTNYPLGQGYLYTYGTADLDGDGKMEIVGQSSNRILVYESPDVASFPSVLVWTSPPLTNVTGEAAFGDSDGDCRMEIIHSLNSFGGGTPSRLLIFENTGDNEYAEVFNAPMPGNGATGNKVILDLDRDGRREIALCGGWLYVFEAIADDQWQEVGKDSTGLLNAYSTVGGTDSDGNGRAELFVRGNDLTVFPPTTWPARVYESAADNEFHLAATIPVPGYGSGGPVSASSDLDGDGAEEYVTLETRPLWDPPPGGVWIYAAVAVGEWQPVAMLQNPENTMMVPAACDLDANGKSEIVWTGNPTSRVFAHLPTSNVVPIPQARTLSVFPNPMRRTARIEWGGADQVAAALFVYDVGGRLVERHDLRGRSLEWRPSRIAAGVYLLQLRDVRGTSLASTRAIVTNGK